MLKGSNRLYTACFKNLAYTNQYLNINLGVFFAKSLQSSLTLCNLMDCSPPGSSVCRILQARILEWVAMPSSKGSSQPRDRTHVFSVSSIGRQVLYH